MNPENPDKSQQTQNPEDTNPQDETASSEGNVQAEAIPETDPVEELQKKLMYQQAEFENSRKRLMREQERSIQFANERIIRELLTVVDLFDRAMLSATPIKKDAKSEVANFVLGIEMTQKELIQMLERFGVVFHGKVGEPFDPERHEAISQVESEPENANKVVAIHQQGCTLHGRLLQPAKVVVGKENDPKGEA